MKGPLQAMRAVLRSQAFDCFDRFSVAPQREHEAGRHRLAIDEDGASTALASVAADLCAGQTNDLTQIIDQKLVFGDGIVAPSTVKPQMDELFPSGFRLPLRHELARHRNSGASKGGFRSRCHDKDQIEGKDASLALPAQPLGYYP